uniref:(northern house mosquito) hypothetical protein n=1 Tax=Culex pipiens TaxID=7175 RepID=A0A8D8BDJ0_CULPI
MSDLRYSPLKKWPKTVCESFVYIRAAACFVELSKCWAVNPPWCCVPPRNRFRFPRLAVPEFRIDEQNKCGFVTSFYLPFFSLIKAQWPKPRQRRRQSPPSTKW